MNQMPMRMLRIVLVGVGAYAAYLVLEPYGLGWLVLPGALAIIVGLFTFRWVRVRRLREEIAREEAWALSVMDGAKRPAAIDAVRDAVADAVGKGAVDDQVRLTVLLSDLIDAEGRRDEADALLGSLDMRTLPPIEGGVVRHARATLRLREGDAEGARAVLKPRAPRTGDEDLDLRLELLDAAADLELGEAEGALEVAVRIRRAAGADETLALEARIIRASALDALGDRVEALEALGALGTDVVEALMSLGGPRLRGLAEEAQEAQEASESSEASEAASASAPDTTESL